MIKLLKYEEISAPYKEELSTHLFYSESWLRVLQQQYNCEYFATLDEASGGIMLFARIKCLVGQKLLSLPFSDYTRPNLAGPQDVPAHIQVLREYFPDLPVSVKINFNQKQKASPVMLENLTEQGCLHRVDTGKEVQLERKMYSSFRRGVRKANSRGLNFVSNCSPEGLRLFYALFYELRMQKHGLIPQPFSFFEKVYKEFISKGNGFFAEVWKDDRLLSSAIVLRHGDGLYYKWGCSSLADLRDRPNNLLFYDLLHLAQRDGFAFVDLGLSDLGGNQGLIHFKKSMGGEASDILSYRFLPEDYPFDTVDQFKSIVNAMACIVVDSRFDRKTTESFSQTLYPLFA